MRKSVTTEREFYGMKEKFCSKKETLLQKESSMSIIFYCKKTTSVRKGELCEEKKKVTST